MNDLEISKALALAIGWRKSQMTSYLFSQNLYCHTFYPEGGRKAGRLFSYLDWNVIGPIAAHYNLFPMVAGGVYPEYTGWVARDVLAQTPQKAIAMAVIAKVRVERAVTLLGLS